MLMGDQHGRLVRVFEPRWWRLDRWLWWLAVGRRHAGRVVIDHAAGWKVVVRVVVEDRVRLPRVPDAHP
jgi:hypothetical protein